MMVAKHDFIIGSRSAPILKFLCVAAAALTATNAYGEEMFTPKTQFYTGFLGRTDPTLTDDPTDPCCHSCEEPLEKYHSVDHTFNNCGEACMDPSKFWLYKLFEPNLEKSATNTPCANRNYTDYVNTPTHGVWPITMTLDLYAPTKDLLAEETPEVVE